jgi:hypothetical protein
MSHLHYCDVTGHQWTCAGIDCVCICGALMEDGNHSDCPVELRECREHNGGELHPESSMFAGAIQMMLDDAGVMDDGESGTVPEVKE